MDHHQVKDILGDVDYPGLAIEFVAGGGSAGSVRVRAWRPDMSDGELKLQLGRRWPLSEHMVESEVVQTVFSAIEWWEEHERRENFRYLGQKVFSPHLDLGKLATALRLGALTEQVRDDAR